MVHIYNIRDSYSFYKIGLISSEIDSADFRGLIARPVSDDFRHFFIQIPPNTMVTPSQLWQTTHDSAVLPIWPIFRVRSREAVSMRQIEFFDIDLIPCLTLFIVDLIVPYC